MDFLRRILGRPDNSTAVGPSNDGIQITQDSAEPARPPEPVIEPPVNGAVAANEAAPTVVADVPPPKKVEMAGTRPLPPIEPMVPGPGQRLHFGQLSDVGMARTNNQDAVLSIVASSSSNDDLPDFGLFVVADGMGGHHDGEKASALATRIVSEHVIEQIFMAMLTQRMNDPDRPTITDVLREAVQHANDIVSDRVPDGGTTVTSAVILGDLAYVVHVGDSRAYLVTPEGIEQLTRDHSLVQRLIELDQLTPEEAAEHPQRNVLYRALGQSENLDVDAITRRLGPHARLLLCSDGLWNLVTEETIRTVVQECLDPQEACKRLVDLANERGGPDNVTVILVQVPG
ncbi:MAG: serine/threonine-protein phosphatase [Chloroflexi bacterium]|nr:serine/threonine-protein phosphatase [Chloroflexota bacterium]